MNKQKKKGDVLIDLKKLLKEKKSIIIFIKSKF